MSALIASVALFGVAWLLHVTWWRVRLPRRHMAALLGLFAAFPLFAGPAWFALPQGTLDPADLPAIFALYASAAMCYLIVYTGVEQSSPTLVIVRALEQARGNGCTDADLAQLITEDLFVRPRLEALALDGLVEKVGGGWALTPRGYRTARIAAKLARAFGIREIA